MERSIPHVRDIFGVPFSGHHHGNNHMYHHHPPPPRLPIYQALAEKELPAKLKDMSLQHHTSHHHASNHHKYHHQPGSDSAVSVGSSEEEGGVDDDSGRRQRRRKKNGRERPSRRDTSDASQIQSRTLRARDVQHLERHLSMKKTIRKKIMRDLQQAFVEDPSEFRMDPRRISPERMKAVNIQNLVLSPPTKGEPTFLDMLRDDDSGNGSPTREKMMPSGPASASGMMRPPSPVEDTRRNSKSKDAAESNASSSSFWKRFTMKKNKR